MFVKQAGMIVKKAPGTESEILAAAGGPWMIYGVILTSAASVDADAVLTPVVNGADLAITMTLAQNPHTQSIPLPFPIKCESLKATLTGAGTEMWINYGV